MNTIKYPRWSEWRKWDLHVHSPSSLIQEYGGDTTEVWELFISDLEKLSSDFKVIWINDYLFLDWYKKVLEFKKNWRLANIDLILPIIEFRLKEFVGHEELKKLNYHIIFADKSILPTPVIEAHFLSLLSSSCKLNQDLPASVTWWWVLTRDTLADLWKWIRESTPEGKRSSLPGDLELGFNNLSFELSKIEEALGELKTENTYLKGKYLKAIGKAEWESFRWTGSPGDKKTTINGAHFVFSASPWESEAKKGKESLESQGVNSRLLHCSDAHAFSSVPSEPKKIGHCLTWIKADPTFEWLRQVVYEPNERIRIQAEKPDMKSGYRIIDKVTFDDDSFTNKEILLNPNLNVIIWSRSSWKSTLLGHIAYTIDPYQVKEREYRPKQWSNFKVFWSDGAWGNKENQPENRGIVFIPQNYINNLAEATNPDAYILQLIESSLLWNKEGGKDFEWAKSALETSLFEIKSEIEEGTTRLFSALRKFSEQRTYIKTLWDKKGVEAEIKKFADQMSALQKDFTEPEKNKFEEVLKLGIENKRKIEDIDSDLAWLENFGQRQDLDAVIFRSIEFPLKGEEKKVSFEKAILEFQGTFINNLKTKLTASIAALHKEKLELEKANSQLREENKDLLQKWLANKQLSKLSDDRKIQLEKVEKIRLEEKKLEVISKEISDSKASLLSLSQKRFNLLWSFAKSIDMEIGDIRYSAELKNDGMRFEKFFSDSINYHYSKWAKDKFSTPEYFDSDGNFMPISLLSDMGKTLDLLLEEEEDKKLKIKSGLTLEAVVRGMLAEYGYIKYSIKYEDDEYEDMTPWKKALVVLKLLIESTDDNSPILIDQPEDDLDSRSVYGQISDFLKKKKRDRQIVIVTHNANIAIWADAEEVIVANRHGVDTPNTSEIPFDYATGSLECTFIQEIALPCTLEKQWIREHACSILEWGEDAFVKRQNKYAF